MKKQLLISMATFFAAGQVGALEPAGGATQPPLKISAATAASSVPPAKSSSSTAPQTGSHLTDANDPKYPWQESLSSAVEDYQNGNYKNALTKMLPILKEIESRDPNTVELIYVLIPLSRVYDGMDLLKDSQDTAERAIKLAEMTPPRTKTLLDQGFKPQRLGAICKDMKGAALSRLGEFLANQWRDTEAQPVLERAVAVWGDGSVDSAYPQSLLADIYSRSGKYAQAEKVYKQVVALNERESSSSDPESLALALRDLGYYYHERGDYQQAEATFQKAIADLKKKNMATSVHCADLYGYLGDTYRYRGQLAEAEKAYRMHLDLFTQAKVSDLSTPLAELGKVLVMEGRPGEAEPFYNRAATHSISVKKNIFIDVVLTAQDGTAKSAFQKSFGGTVTDLALVMEATKARMDPNSAQYAKFLEDVAFAYPYFKIKKQPVIPIIEQAIQIRKRLNPVNAAIDPNIANDEFLIAHRLALMGGYFTTNAVESYNIYKRLGERNDPSLKSSQPAVLRLAYLLAADSTTRAKAEEMANLALTHYSADSPVLAREMYGFGMFYEALGEYAKAQTAYDTAYSWSKQHNSPELVRAAVAAARVCYLENDYDVAWQKAKIAEELCQKIWGPSYFQTNGTGMSCLETLTSIARCRGDLDTAEKYARQLCLRANFKLDNNQVARHYLELATILGMLQKVDEAKSHAHKAVDVLSNIGEKSYLDKVELAKAHLLLATFAMSAQDKNLADAEYRQAYLYHMEDKSIQGSLGRVADFNGFAYCSTKPGSRYAAHSVLSACEILDKYISSGFGQLSFAEQCAFIKCVRDEMNPLLSVGVSNESPDEPFKYVMRWQGLLIDAVRRQNGLERSGDAQTVAQLRKIRQELSQLSSGAHGKADLVASAIQTKTETKEVLERKLAFSAAAASSADPVLKMTPKEFTNTLAPDEALVDIIRYKDLSTGKSGYYGFAVSKTNGIKGFRLGDADEIDKLSGTWLHAMASNSGTARDISVSDEQSTAETSPIKTSELEDTATRKLWMPIKAILPQGVRKVWMCPDSRLATLPWSIMVDKSESGRILTSQVDSPRALLQLKTPGQSSPSQDLFVVGGIEFARKSLFLPGTLSEVDDISKLAEQSKIHLSKLTGAEPTKDQVLKHLSNATYAHLATHGFFDQSGDSAPTKAGSSTMAEDLLASQRSFVTVSGGEGSVDTTAVIAARNPLVLSGLLVAPTEEAGKDKGAHSEDANASDTVEASSTDDRLTAEELVGQDLSRCKLVVLSACNTGRGKDYEGQGVLGLRAALIGAGSRGVLMSLWSVDDRATKELMKDFYQNLWNPSHPMKPVEALRMAQDSVRSTPGGKWQHPYYWAGWIFDGIGW